MTNSAKLLPITETIAPADQQETAEAIRDRCASQTPIYPIGGGSSLDFGLPAKQEGVGLSLAGLNRVIDFPARDMTVTVEAGVTMQALAETLATEKQRLPVDAPHAAQATVGGVVATNFNGPRRYGLGSLRDYVIGVTAIDGVGTVFRGGGRVVKNVAGYDFCKLLTGSLGTLGVITQVTLKLRPLAERSLLMVCRAADLDQAEQRLAALAHSQTTPAAIELLSGPAWDNDPALNDDGDEASGEALFLAVGLEGTGREVDWMAAQLAKEWREQGVGEQKTIAGPAADGFWRRLAEFPAAADAPLVLKASVAPSGATRFIAAAREADPDCSIQAHAGNGVVVVRFSRLPASGLSRTVVGRLQPLAAAVHGNVIMLSNPGRVEMTRQSVWGGMNAPFALMSAVKQKFDPQNLLNPGRFVFS